MPLEMMVQLHHSFDDTAGLSKNSIPAYNRGHLVSMVPQAVGPT